MIIFFLLPSYTLKNGQKKHRRDGQDRLGRCWTWEGAAYSLARCWRI